MKYYLKGNRTGRYFVLGQGFVASIKAGASKLTNAQVSAALALGFEPSTTEQVRDKSFAVNYVRAGEAGYQGRVQSNRNNPSSRRFATFDEAWQHGTKARSRADSATHVGFSVAETGDPVNAAINWETGLTNSL